MTKNWVLRTVSPSAALSLGLPKRALEYYSYGTQPCQLLLWSLSCEQLLGGYSQMALLYQRLRKVNQAPLIHLE